MANSRVNTCTHSTAHQGVAPGIYQLQSDSHFKQQKNAMETLLSALHSPVAWWSNWCHNKAARWLYISKQLQHLLVKYKKLLNKEGRFLRVPWLSPHDGGWWSLGAACVRESCLHKSEADPVGSSCHSLTKGSEHSCGAPRRDSSEV